MPGSVHFGIGMEQRFLKSPQVPPSDQIFPADFSARCCFPRGFLQTGRTLPDVLPDPRNSSSCGQESAQGWREAPEEHHKTSAPKSNYGQGWNYPFAWKLKHILVGAVGRERWLHRGNSWESPCPAQLSWSWWANLEEGMTASGAGSLLMGCSGVLLRGTRSKTRGKLMIKSLG